MRDSVSVFYNIRRLLFNSALSISFVAFLYPSISQSPGFQNYDSENHEMAPRSSHCTQHSLCSHADGTPTICFILDLFIYTFDKISGHVCAFN
jgi:hypothetical protein